MGWIFLSSGWRKLMDVPGFVKTMPRRGLPGFLGYVAPPVEFVGGICLILGFATRYAALVMLLFVIIASFSSHRYWAVEAAQYGNQSSHFWKNVAIKGGLVFLFITGAGRYALDWMLAKKR
jgi:putative oxidoreductase